MASQAPGAQLALVIRWLLDTGPLVAFLDARDPAHQAVAARLQPFTGELITTSAVVTEAMHFLGGVGNGPRLLSEFLTASGTRIYDLSQPPELTEAVKWMEKYSDTPMDYADATLVLLAEALDVNEILTLDRRGFSTFRARQGQAFRLVLDLIQSQ